jgi:hypothetical protein
MLDAEVVAEVAAAVQMDHDNEPAPDNVVQQGDAIPDIFNTQ